MNRKLSCLPLLLLTALAACAQSPSEELRAEAQSALSWAATVRLAGEAWSEGKVTDAYARRTVETAQQTLRETAEALDQSKEVPADRRVLAREQIRAIEQTAAQVRAAIEGGDRAALARSLDRLKAQQQTLDAFVKSAGGGGEG